MHKPCVLDCLVERRIFNIYTRMLVSNMNIFRIRNTAGITVVIFVRVFVLDMLVIRCPEIDQPPSLHPSHSLGWMQPTFSPPAPLPQILVFRPLALALPQPAA